MKITSSRGITPSLMLFIFATGCSTMVGTGGVYSAPKDSASQCSTQCASVGLALDSVVIMANNVGCVCRGGKAAVALEDGAPAGGMAAILMASQQQEQQKQSQNK